MPRLSYEIVSVIVPALHEDTEVWRGLQLIPITGGKSWEQDSRTHALSCQSVYFLLQMATSGNIIHDGEKQEMT